jgi:DNA-damage-inducible protein D
MVVAVGFGMDRVSGTIPMPKGAEKEINDLMLTRKAKDFATEITNFNIKRDDLRHEPEMTSEHIRNNQDVRKVLTERGIKPEELPPAEDIRKLERRVKSEEKLLAIQTGKLKK